MGQKKPLKALQNAQALYHSPSVFGTLAAVVIVIAVAVGLLIEFHRLRRMLGGTLKS